ncbi:MAG TPA: CpsB/CapC family capsule biosynthesis tyrosine phosphatase [Polyangiaceae bacterium]|nr:CpsB/CapC family capsule biosynthesis tyrosine phosphatase [Polyangiaceae bacterium]
MHGFVDLHCHWIAGIDDGAPTPDDGIAMLQALHAAGFERVVATPHMRNGMFENDKAALVAAFDRMAPSLAAASGLPEVALGCEHYFDDVVYQRLLAGEGLPYPGGRAVLLEFYGVDFPPFVVDRLFDLRRRSLLPVIAHPERYRYLWSKPDALERLVDAGVAALLDVAALVGKYGREPQRAAEAMLERGLYHAACSDAHRPADVAEVTRGIERVEKLYGADEVEFLLSEGPKLILEGKLPE